MNLDGSMTLRLQLPGGKVHAWDGVKLACGARSAGRGTPVNPRTPPTCGHCIDRLNRQTMRSLRAFTAAARKHGYLP